MRYRWFRGTCSCVCLVATVRCRTCGVASAGPWRSCSVTPAPCRAHPRRASCPARRPTATGYRAPWWCWRRWPGQVETSAAHAYRLTCRCCTPWHRRRPRPQHRRTEEPAPLLRHRALLPAIPIPARHLYLHALLRSALQHVVREDDLARNVHRNVQVSTGWQL